MAALRPHIDEIERRHKDPRRRSEAMRELYREAGVKPFAQLGTSLLQVPVWIAIYQALRMVLVRTPERAETLIQRLYPWSYLQSAVPLPAGFLWLDLARPDPAFLMMGLVALTTWLSIRLSRSAADPSAAQARAITLMQWIGPIMATGFALGAPSRLTLYWVASNLATIALNRSLDALDRRAGRMPALPGAAPGGGG
jgi:YidC/Oxa1 family membrane protein insertase